jgi:hypothetical protein
MRKGLKFLAIACIASFMVGCGPPGAKTPSFYPVRGQVLLDGQPVRFAIVSLSPAGAEDSDSPPATGQTNANGEFSIRTMMGPGYDGAMPGDYWVSLYAPGKGPAEANGGKPTAIPQKYRNPKTAKISVSVKEETNDLGTIRLQS